eukprot:TRINITY_DN15440_c0_g1_i1.p1 TRINITY_DN15440_c0_g1~~TRINITY_DN15440_c0_g1_i1.p1  ORF type:complete len:132 (+),score=50.00 TRINITY_DN15440_c0_g1_i1:25-396(+)
MSVGKREHCREAKMIHGMVREIPRPNPFLSFLFDNEFIYIGIKRKNLRFLRECLGEEVRRFLDEHTRLIYVPLGRRKKEEVVEFYLEKARFPCFVRMVIESLEEICLNKFTLQVADSREQKKC